jgi:alkylation response protein AidB-like acyl-CoA dehydrogenase
MNFELTEQQLELQVIARRFAYEEVRPQSLELDRIADPNKLYPLQLIKRASALGLRTLKIPVEYGGRGVDVLTECIVLEELAAGDGGFAMLMQHPWREGSFLAGATTPRQRERFLPEFMADDTYMTSYAITEAHSGSDHTVPYTGELSAGPQTTAVLEGDEWVINGSKRFITNINNAKLIILHARTDTAVPWNEGISLIVVPTSTPGFRVMKVQDKIGLRLNPNGDAVFDNCRVPRDNLLGEVNKAHAQIRKFGKGTKTKGASRAVGIARAAYEEALAWVKKRRQGGKLLIEHQVIAHGMADLARQIEMARTLVWRAAWAVDQGLPDANRLEAMAKITATDTVANVSRRALEFFGGWGVGRENVIEKLTRDAATMLHAPAGNDAFREHLSIILARGQKEAEGLKVGH